MLNAKLMTIIVPKLMTSHRADTVQMRDKSEGAAEIAV